MVADRETTVPVLLGGQREETVLGVHRWAHFDFRKTLDRPGTTSLLLAGHDGGHPEMGRSEQQLSASEDCPSQALSSAEPPARRHDHGKS